ncbi:DNA-methyltransferase [Candidatus Symbiobacter mobilis]|uniref:Methyltransferase n=1 Tax=Candidatus Symbiobacter mobilis CR TaxID=946483 RepID=U5NC01_9BURK|nr:DNA methyltransferase [Candidatus Symbiobacter mobilis]AGX87773.1 DNA methyltransferase-like protein [Candidatus Symbiobacter mobilis CR]
MEIKNQTLFHRNHSIAHVFDPSESVIAYHGDCLDLLKSIPNESLQLIVTSPPYNIGKEYETKLHLDVYLQQQAKVITECVRALSQKGSICWQVGNYVDKGAIIPLDTVLYPIFSKLGLKMRNRIIWHFEKTEHPCQFPVELIERFVLSLTNEGDWVLDVVPWGSKDAVQSALLDTNPQ